MADNPLGIPLWLWAITAAIIVGMIILSKKRPAGRRRGGTPKRKVKETKPDITSLVGKPESKEENKQKLSSVEDILAGKADNAPSLGEENKTEISSSLGMLKLEGEDDEPKKPVKAKPVEVKPTVSIEPEPVKEVKKDLIAAGETGKASFSLDEFADELEEPEDYMEPPSVTISKSKPSPPPKPVKQHKDTKINSVRQELRKGLLKRVLQEKPPEKVGEKGARYYCMECFDRGMSPLKVSQELRKNGIPGERAKELSNTTYKLWIEKREKMITKLKELNDRLKRIHYKFLKRQIDEKTRKDMIIDVQKQIVELESKIKTTDKFFED